MKKSNISKLEEFVVNVLQTEGDDHLESLVNKCGEYSKFRFSRPTVTFQWSCKYFLEMLLYLKKHDKNVLGIFQEQSGRKSDPRNFISEIESADNHHEKMLKKLRNYLDKEIEVFSKNREEMRGKIAKSLLSGRAVETVDPLKNVVDLKNSDAIVNPSNPRRGNDVTVSIGLRNHRNEYVEGLNEIVVVKSTSQHHSYNHNQYSHQSHSYPIRTISVKNGQCREFLRFEETGTFEIILKSGNTSQTLTKFRVSPSEEDLINIDSRNSSCSILYGTHDYGIPRYEEFGLEIHLKNMLNDYITQEKTCTIRHNNYEEFRSFTVYGGRHEIRGLEATKKGNYQVLVDNIEIFSFYVSPHPDESKIDESKSTVTLPSERIIEKKVVFEEFRISLRNRWNEMIEESKEIEISRKGSSSFSSQKYTVYSGENWSKSGLVFDVPGEYVITCGSIERNFTVHQARNLHVTFVNDFEAVEGIEDQLVDQMRKATGIDVKVRMKFDIDYEDSYELDEDTDVILYMYGRCEAPDFGEIFESQSRFVEMSATKSVIFVQLSASVETHTCLENKAEAQCPGYPSGILLRKSGRYCKKANMDGYTGEVLDNFVVPVKAQKLSLNSDFRIEVFQKNMDRLIKLLKKLFKHIVKNNIE